MHLSHKRSRQLSFGEEVANASSHGLAALSLLVFLPVASIHSFQTGGGLTAFGTAVFVSSLFLMFLSSAIYHAMSYTSVHKSILRIIDHSMIFIAITGSYTPILLALMNNWWGYAVLIFQWGSSLLGILYTIFAPRINGRLSLIFYLLMGWVVVLILPPILAQTGPLFWGLMLAGGLAYTIGAIFYAAKRPYFHFIWHLFIMLASSLQTIAIIYVM